MEHTRVGELPQPHVPEAGGAGFAGEKQGAGTQEAGSASQQESISDEARKRQIERQAIIDDVRDNVAKNRDEADSKSIIEKARLSMEPKASETVVSTQEPRVGDTARPIRQNGPQNLGQFARAAEMGMDLNLVRAQQQVKRAQQEGRTAVLTPVEEQAYNTFETGKAETLQSAFKKVEESIRFNKGFQFTTQEQLAYDEFMLEDTRKRLGLKAN